jgi:transposase InsO family protein
VLEEAFARYGLPDIVNTDQGSQFTAGAFTDAVLGRQVRVSMDGKGAWRDNVFVERVWRSIKYEEVYLKAYESVSHARRSIGEYQRNTPLDRHTLPSAAEDSRRDARTRRSPVMTNPNRSRPHDAIAC